MSEDKRLKEAKKKMSVCTILQMKFGCKCAKNETIPFCSTVEELYKQQEYVCLNCELYKEAHEPKAWR